MKLTKEGGELTLKNIISDFKESIYDLEHPKVTRNEFTKGECGYCHGKEMNSGVGISHLQEHLKEFEELTK